jgi:hypothetical protein
MEFDSMFLGALVSVAPSLVGWITVLVLAAVMLRRGGGRAERFLVAGASLKIISNLLNIPGVAIVPWLVFHADYSPAYAESVVFGYEIFRGVVGMAGIICLIYAFYVKFGAKNLERSLPQQL